MATDGYTEIEVHSVTIRSIHCPHCGKDKEYSHRVDHLMEAPQSRPDGRNAGPWFCDACERSFFLRVMPDGRVFWRSHDKRKVRMHTRLIVEPDPKPLVFELVGMQIVDPSQPIDDHESLERSRYYYEEHTCPTNVLGNVHTVYLGEDDDPHGIFSLLSETPLQ